MYVRKQDLEKMRTGESRDEVKTLSAVRVFVGETSAVVDVMSGLWGNLS